MINHFIYPIAANLTPRLIGFISFLCLSNFLTPKDYGIASIGIAVVGFCKVLWETSINRYVIASNKLQIDDIAMVNSMSSIIGLVLSCIVILLSEYIAKLFNDLDAIECIRASSLQILITGFGACVYAYCQKKLQYKLIFFANLSAATASSLTMLLMSLNGFGFWSIVFANIIGQLLLFIVLSFRTKLPFRIPSYDKTIQFIKFSKWATLDSTVGWFFIWADAVIVSGKLGVGELGIYRYASNLVNTLYNSIIGGITPFLFSKMANDNENKDLKISLNIYQPLVFTFGLILYVSVFVFSDGIRYFANSDWNGLSAVIVLYSLTQLIFWITGINYDAIIVKGKQKQLSLINAFKISYHVCIYVIAIDYGIFALLISRVICATIDLIIDLFFQRRILDLKVCSTMFRTTVVFIITLLIYSPFIIFIDKINHSGLQVYMASVLIFCVISYFYLCLWFKFNNKINYV